MTIKFIPISTTVYPPTGGVIMHIPALKKLQERQQKYEKDHKWSNKKTYLKIVSLFICIVVGFKLCL